MRKPWFSDRCQWNTFNFTAAMPSSVRFTSASGIQWRATSSIGVVNAANFMVNTLPGGGIAQGSIFTIFGSGLGPANYVQVSSFPLGPQFNGVSINLKQGSQQISGIPLFVYATQINALLPSNTPLGTVSLQVVYNGQASNWAPVDR